MRTALVIVHLSSIDSYAEFVGTPAAAQLSERITSAVRAHRGPVYIIDQGWDGPLRNAAVKRMHGVHGRWLHFDEDVDDWNRFLPAFKRQLTRERVDQVVIGGIWYDPDLKTGCATEVYLYLRRAFPTKVAPDLVGCETD